MGLFEHQVYNKDLRNMLKDDNRFVLAKGKPQDMKMGAEVSPGIVITDLYTVAVVGPVDDPETAA